MLREFMTSGIADAALAAHLRFTAPGCAGFSFIRRPGISARYRVHVYDDHVSRLLVLAAILNYDRYCNAHPHRETQGTDQ